MIFTSLTHFKQFAKAFMAWFIVLVMFSNPLQMAMAASMHQSHQDIQLHGENSHSMMLDHMKGKHLSKSDHKNSCCDSQSCIHLSSASSLHRKMQSVEVNYASSKISYALENDDFLISYYPEQPKRPPRV